jgi:hypothetical protein
MTCSPVDVLIGGVVGGLVALAGGTAVAFILAGWRPRGGWPS